MAKRKNTSGRKYSKPEKLDKYTPRPSVSIEDIDPEDIIDKDEIASILSGDDVKKADEEFSESVMPADDDSDLKNAPRERTAIQNLGATVLEFVRHNSTIFTVIVASLIVVETAMVLYDPHKWWIPVLSVFGIGLVVLLWANARFVLKLVGTLAVLTVCEAFAVMSGSALQNNSLGGVVWFTIMLAGFAVSLFSSYLINSNKSRWPSIGIGIAIGFVVGYAFIPMGVLIASASDAITMVLVTIVVMLAPISSFFRSRRMPKPSRLSKEQLSVLIESMDSLSDRYKYGFLDKKNTLLVFHAEDMPTYVFIPMRFTKELKERRGRGLVYRGVRFDSWLRLKMMKIEGKIKKPVPVVTVLDLNGINEDANEDAMVIDVPIIDSINVAHAGLVGMKPSRRPMRSKIRRLYEKFGGASVASAKDEIHVSKRLHSYESDDADKTQSESKKES